VVVERPLDKPIDVPGAAAAAWTYLLLADERCVEKNPEVPADGVHVQAHPLRQRVRAKWLIGRLKHTQER